MIYNVAKNKKIFSEISQINSGGYPFYLRVLRRLLLLVLWSFFVFVSYIIIFRVSLPSGYFIVRMFACFILSVLIYCVIETFEHYIFDRFYEKHKYKILDKLLSQYKPLDVNEFINLKDKTNNNVVDFPDYLMDFVRAEDKAYRESVVFNFAQK